MFCGQCGKQADPGDQFCSGCGKKLGTTTAPTWNPFAPADTSSQASTAPSSVQGASAPPLDDLPAYDTLFSGGGAASASTSDTESEDGGMMAECPICFGELCNEPCAVLARSPRVSRGGRVCRHYIHERCANALTTGPRPACPKCGRSFSHVWVVPQLLRDPEAWFNAVDLDGNGTLSRREVVDALCAELPVDLRLIDHQLVAEAWARWDPNHDNELSKEELLGPGGLVDWMKIKFPLGARPPPPPIADKHMWYVWLYFARASCSVY